RDDVVVTDAGGIFRFVAVDGKSAGAGIESIQTAAFRADPERAGAIFEYQRDKIIGERIGIIAIIFIYGKSIAVEFVEAIFGGKPEQTVAVLANTINSILREP